MGRLEGRVAIVTGGAKGIGRQYCQALAAEGAKVVVADIADPTAAAAAINDAYGAGTALGIATDVAREEAVERMVAATIDRFGKIDVVVNNAALFATLPLKPAMDWSTEQWDQVMAVNVRGPFLVAKHAAPHMIDRQYGKIINIGSTIASKGLPMMLPYVTSKGAIFALTRALSRELGQHGICVNTLAPGLVLSDSVLENDQHVEFFRGPVLQSRAIRRDAYPEDLFGALVFLASSDSDFITGQTLAVDGGAINT
jgi:NAD(P)-dependent dehydrogenase (short-subunit alcohol dehydrogenase family)